MPFSIFLIDHAWTYEAEYARKQLRSIPGLARRIVALMDLEESLKSSSAEQFYTNDDGTVIPIKRCMNSAVGKTNSANHRVAVAKPARQFGHAMQI